MPDLQTPQPHRTVLVSSYFPPVVGGTSTVLRNLVSKFDPQTFSIVTEHRELPTDAPKSPIPPGLNIRKTALPSAPFKKIPYIWRWKRFFRFFLILRVRNLTLRAIKETGANCILGIYPNWPFLIGAYLAHRKSGLPLVTYHMDIPVRRSAMAAFERFFIKAYEGKILRAAKERFIISGGYAQDFTQRFGLESTLLPHAIDLQKIRKRLPSLPGPPSDGPTRIVHTGIVEGQKEGLLRIARTLHKNPNLDARLILSTPTPRERLLREGFDLPCVEILSLPQEKVLELQAGAHILITVLPFHHKTKEGALTGYPTKLVEYLAVARPILIHAPSWAYLCQHARQYDYAEIADNPCPEALAETIRKLQQDHGRAQQLVQNAKIHAENFDIPKIAKQFVEAISI